MKAIRAKAQPKPAEKPAKKPAAKKNLNSRTHRAVMILRAVATTRRAVTTTRRAVTIHPTVVQIIHQAVTLRPAATIHRAAARITHRAAMIRRNRRSRSLLPAKVRMIQDSSTKSGMVLHGMLRMLQRESTSCSPSAIRMPGDTRL